MDFTLHVSGYSVHLQALFNSLPPEDYKNGVLVLGGDGRYFNKEAAQVDLFEYIRSCTNKITLILICSAGFCIADNNQNCCWKWCWKNSGWKVSILIS